MRTLQDVKCFHCGQPCEEESFEADGKAFCCYGCKIIYEVIHSNDMCEYYSINEHPGVRGPASSQAYDYLNERRIRKEILEFDSPDMARVRFSVPAIHCASCIWLLENLKRINSAILRSEVDFGRKTVVIDFQPGKVTLSDVATILDSIGYAPAISLAGKNEIASATDKSLLLKLGVAGFCFGNVMLFSFPEYLGIDQSEALVGKVFSVLNLTLAIPVMFYSATGYFTSALNSFRQKQVNIDVPIALGLLALFFRSVWEIGLGHGPGYMDSFTGLVFFLLIGKWFQNKTYESLAFERDFRSYFPLSTQRWLGNEWRPVVINELAKGDLIRVRNLEIVPADSFLQQETALIDYSFVTGEARPVKVRKHDLVYAGGRLIGQPADLIVDKAVSQSQLTSLWNHEAFRKPRESRYHKLIDQVARKFTWAVLALAAGTAIFWYLYDPSRVWLVVTAVLMVACPCTLALAAPFTYGSAMRIFGRNEFYLKNSDVIERLASVNNIVFDKTGTLTHGTRQATFVGDLSAGELRAIHTLTSFSSHPLSQRIAAYTAGDAPVAIDAFVELPGKGIQGTADGAHFKIGSAEFTGASADAAPDAANIFVSVGGVPRGYFSFSGTLRKELRPMVARLGPRRISLVSGDNNADRDRMRALFSDQATLRFNQSPQEKMQYVRNLQVNGETVLMMGDGLNDAGALRQADVGVAVTDDTGLFTPSCDAIVKGDRLKDLDSYLNLARLSNAVLRSAFFVSFSYNAVALVVAMTGHLTPLVAAVLMPLSSISVVGFCSLGVRLAARRTIGKV